MHGIFRKNKKNKELHVQLQMETRIAKCTCYNTKGFTKKWTSAQECNIVHNAVDVQRVNTQSNSAMAAESLINCTTNINVSDVCSLSIPSHWKQTIMQSMYVLSSEALGSSFAQQKCTNCCTRMESLFWDSIQISVLQLHTSTTPFLFCLSSDFSFFCFDRKKKKKTDGLKRFEHVND